MRLIASQNLTGSIMN